MAEENSYNSLEENMKALAERLSDNPSEEEIKEKRNVEKVIVKRTYVYDTGQMEDFEFTENKNKEKHITNFRQTQLVNEPWKPKSYFVKLYTGGRSKPIIPQFQPKGYAQYYLNSIPFIRPEENCLGAYDELGAWYSFTKEQYREALDLKRNTFDRFLEFCLGENILSIYGRNDNVSIYMNPVYWFNGREPHINLCLAFDHDDKFIKAMSKPFKEAYLKKKQELILTEDLGEVVTS